MQILEKRTGKRLTAASYSQGLDKKIDMKLSSGSREEIAESKLVFVENKKEFLEITCQLVKDRKAARFVRGTLVAKGDDVEYSLNIDLRELLFDINGKPSVETLPVEVVHNGRSSNTSLNILNPEQSNFTRLDDVLPPHMKAKIRPFKRLLKSEGDDRPRFSNSGILYATNTGRAVGVAICCAACYGAAASITAACCTGTAGLGCAICGVLAGGGGSECCGVCKGA
jgi:hypothetical protein